MTILSNKIALVTGAARGIGAATATILAQKGAKVYATDIDETTGKVTVAAINEGGEAVFLPLDVSKKDQINDVIQQIIQQEGRLDLAVNNAGIGGKMTPLHLVEEADWHQMMAINLTGQFLCMQAEIKTMMANGGGNIVNVSSLAGVNGMAYGGPYSASKHGLIGLTKTAAREYGQYNIRVNAVCPSFIETDIIGPIPDKVLDFSKKFMVPMKRLGKAQEVANTIAYLLSDEASYINGMSMFIDGGTKA